MTHSPNKKTPQTNVKKLTLLAVYATIALTIFTAESFLPPLVPLPGVKLGLSNIVTLWLLMHTKARDALWVLLARIVLSSFFAGQMISLLYSLTGGIFCFAAMALLFRILGSKYIVFISIFGALFHNLGQIIIAICITQLPSMAAYLPVLAISGVATGAFTGLCAFYLKRHLPPKIAWPM